MMFGVGSGGGWATLQGETVCAASTGLKLQAIQPGEGNVMTSQKTWVMAAASTEQEGWNPKKSLGKAAEGKAVGMGVGGRSPNQTQCQESGRLCSPGILATSQVVEKQAIIQMDGSESNKLCSFSIFIYLVTNKKKVGDRKRQSRGYIWIQGRVPSKNISWVPCKSQLRRHWSLKSYEIPIKRHPRDLP